MMLESDFYDGAGFQTTYEELKLRAFENAKMAIIGLPDYL